MGNASKKVIAIALTGACAVGAWKLGGACLDWMSSDDVAGVEHFQNQVWIDRLPADERDMIQHLVFINSRDGRFGAVGKSSVWRHFVEVFLWKLSQDNLRLYFPQDEAGAGFKVRTWECEDEAPEPFQLCLELSRRDRSLVMYSRYEWVVEPHMDAGEQQALVTSIAADYPALATAFEHAVAATGEDAAALVTDARAQALEDAPEADLDPLTR
ncbi:MAG: hypothetical protein H6713_09015 [Myxococcales bacterium]|nr:hypothetical protein [Myxococcales bacterium]MCB9750128.1 hypothetical protein [Myxococcales bacterium]